MKNDFFVVFLDIDGTILNNGTVSQKVKESIALARKKGHKVFVNTARTRANTKAILENICFDGFVTGIGTCVEVNNNIIFDTEFSKSELSFIYDEFGKRNKGIIFDGQINRICNKYFDNNDGKKIIKSREEILECAYDEKIAKCFSNGYLGDDLTNLLSERFSVFQHYSYAEFCKKGCSKAAGMQKVLDFYKVKTEKCVAIGDSINDLDMLSFASISIAMGNADYDVKSKCKYVTKKVEEDGVAYAFTSILECN